MTYVPERDEVVITFGSVDHGDLSLLYEEDGEEFPLGIRLGIAADERVAAIYIAAASEHFWPESLTGDAYWKSAEPEADMGYLSLPGLPRKSRHSHSECLLADLVVVDVDENGKIQGFEIIGMDLTTVDTESLAPRHVAGEAAPARTGEKDLGERVPWLSEFVGEVERGYEASLYDYCDDLDTVRTIRELLDRSEASGDSADVEHLLDRLDEATTPAVVGKASHEFAVRVPRRLTGELLHDLRNEGWRHLAPGEAAPNEADSAFVALLRGVEAEATSRAAGLLFTRVGRSARRIFRSARSKRD